MKRSLTILATSMLLATGAARADGLPESEDTEQRAAGAVNLCEHKAVREVARLEKDLRPLKEIAGYVSNPTGLVLKVVNDHVVEIPEWVGIAIDPRGYARGKAIAFIRNEAKKSVGVDKGCEAEIAERAPTEGA
ncbi:MAG TPA: hypothetical protein VFV90_07975 [Usitatibacter sp.]|nr:hypothetical protein [Usitatibacter sp.]